MQYLALISTPVNAIVMAMGLLYMLALWSNVCIIWSFGSIGFVTMVQPFPMVWSL
jgi:hypothetical protein